MTVHFKISHPDNTWSETAVRTDDPNHYSHVVVVHTEASALRSEWRQYARFLRGLMANYEMAASDGTILTDGVRTTIGGARIPAGMGAWDTLTSAYDSAKSELEAVETVLAEYDLHDKYQVAGWATSEVQARVIRERTYDRLGELKEYSRTVHVHRLEPGVPA